MEYIKSVLKSKAVLMLFFGAVVIVIGYAIISFISQPKNSTVATQDLFAGFSKLIISSANAQDNFVLLPKDVDSLGASPETVYELTSKEPLETALVKENLKIEPDLEYEVKEITSQQWEIIPQHAVEPNTLLKAVIATSYLDENGIQKSYDYSWAYQVKDVFKVLHSIPRNTAIGVPVNSGIEVTFSHDNIGEFEKYFEISPQVDGFFEQHGRTMVFVTQKPMQAGTIYTATVKAGLPVNGSEEKLAEDYVISFETESPQVQRNNDSWLSVSQSFIEVSSLEKPSWQIYASNIVNNKIPTKVYRFADWQSFFQSVQRRDLYPWWSTSKDRYLENTDNLTEVLSVELEILEEDYTQFLQLPNPLEKGDYLIELQHPNYKVQLWLQVSDLATFYTITKTDTVFWINSSSDGHPVGQAAISILDTDYSYRADGDGVARFQIPAEISARADDKSIKKRDYFRVSAGDDNLILPASLISYRYSWDRGSENDNYWNYLYSDRPLYQTTDKIKYWGLLKKRDNRPITEKVVVSLYKEGYVDYYYRPILIAEQTVDLSNDGNYIGEIDIKNLRPDYYTLDIRVGDKIVTRRSISIRPYTKPAYTLSITPDHNKVFAGETVNLKVKAAFFEGTPVPDLDLVMKMPEGEYKFTTNDQGEADLTYTKAYRPCNREYSCWPAYAYISVYPENSELAQISAGTTLYFYGPNVYVDQQIKYPETGVAEIIFDTKFIDFEAMDDNDWWQRSQGDQPAPNIKIQGELVKITYTKVETGTKYDFISKRSYQTYRYDRSESVEDTLNLETDANGHYVYRKNIEPNTSYNLTYKIYDQNGKFDNYSAYLYYYDGQHTWSYSGSSYKYYRLELPEEKRFSVGETVAATFMENDAAMPDRNQGYLYLQYQNGLQEYAVADNSRYNFNFTGQDIPNIGIQGIYFDGSSYIRSTTRDIKFKATDKALKVSITPDKESYLPGEKLTLDFFVRDINDRPTAATVSVNLVDEAFYAVVDETVDPLGVIYNNVGYGIINSRTTHNPTAPDAFGLNDLAEKGGCFLPGTMIDLADGSQKPIEQISVGDKISTFADPAGRAKVSGQVSEIWEHTVAEYLIINERLSVTPEHMVYANGRFTNVASLKIGDWLLDNAGNRVFIEKIDHRYELTKVYNFAVEPQHTFFAAGIYVHNDKGGGPREFFVDTAVFDTVQTNNSGRGSLTITLPDNITSWRVTAQAVSRDLQVGSNTEKVPVSLPVFAEVTIGNEYLAADRPIARLRSFGVALTPNDKVDFFLSAESLGMKQSSTQSAKAFQSTYFDLPELTAGVHDITYNLQTDKGDDAIKLPINVILSRTAAQVAVSEKLTLESKIKPDGDLPIAVILLDQGQNILYQPLQSLSWSHGDRIDQILPRKMSRDLLSKYYGRNYFNNDFNAFDYQTTDGGITLLPYSSQDLELSTRVAATGTAKFDHESLAQYFFAILESRSSNPEEVSYALAGLAALGKPVLPRISVWLSSGEHTVKEKLYLAQALNNLGAKEWSRSIYLEVMKEYAQIKEPEISLRVSENYDEVFHATALAAVLATALDADEAEGLWLFLNNNQRLFGDDKNSENLFNLEKINYIQSTITKLKPSPAKVKYQLYGHEQQVEITGGAHHSFQLDPQDVDQLKFLEITGDVGLTVSYTKPIEVSDLAVDESIGVRREYYVDGQKTDTFAENDLIEVRLYPLIQDSALSGRYQLTDILPSGLEAVTRFYSWNSYRACDYRYPYNAAGQVVKYNVDKNWRHSSCNSEYFKYFARVKNKGTYVAEPAIIQSFVNPAYINYSQAGTVIIR